MNTHRYTPEKTVEEKTILFYSSLPAFILLGRRTGNRTALRPKEPF